MPSAEGLGGLLVMRSSKLWLALGFAAATGVAHRAMPIAAPREGDERFVPRPAVARALETSVAVAEDDFKLGLQIFDRGGNLVLAGGSLVKYPLGLPAELLTRAEPVPIAEGDPPDRLFREVETGEHYPYLVLALPVNEAFVQGSIYKRKFVRNARDAPTDLVVMGGRTHYLCGAPGWEAVADEVAAWIGRHAGGTAS